jgi:hypothetical protein
MASKRSHMSRVCRKCKVEKNDDEFGVLRCSKDGVNPRCKKCCVAITMASKPSESAKQRRREWEREYNKKNREKVNAKGRACYHRHLEEYREKTRIASQKYFQTPEGRENRRKRQEKWCLDNPTKARTHRLFKDAIRNGKIIRPNQCEKCKKSCKPHGHHEDYSKPYEVLWVCEKCHVYIHHQHKMYRERLNEEDPKGYVKV